MTANELHAKMLELHTEYKSALAEHKLGRAGLIRDGAAELLANEWDQVNAALERAAMPLSHGAELDEDDENTFERARASAR